MSGKLLDIDGAAERMNVSPRMIRRLIAQRRLSYLKIGKFVRFDPVALDECIYEQYVKAS